MSGPAASRFLATLATISALLSGCGDELVSDIVSVPSRASDPTPVSSFRSTLAIAAIDLVSVGSFIESDGTVDVTFSDGSRWTGFVDFDSGEFDLLLEMPEGFHLVSIHDVGTFELQSGYPVAAAYRETYEYLSTDVRWDITLDVGFVSMDLAARDLDRGTRVESVTSFLADRIRIRENWNLANGYTEDIDTSYFSEGPAAVTQEWVRDERSTGVSPDSEGELTFFADNSGEGRLAWYYDHGIVGRYEIDQSADGSATATYVFEDPATTVSPDGLGDYTFGKDNSGGGVYTEGYDDGSELVVTDTWAQSGSYDEEFTFDDASTAIAVDADGDAHTRVDGSGDGSWRRYDEDGVVESCQYEFDSAGVTQSVDCE